MSYDYRHTVLVIEDNDEDFMMISQGLADSGVTENVDRMQDLAETMRWLDRANARACLVMTDLNLPDGDGKTLVKAFKNDTRHKTTPVIVFSTSSSEADLRACYDAGANSYHVKPLETPLFHAMVTQIAQYWFNYALTPGNMK